MSMVCPDCSAPHDSMISCPRCAPRLRPRGPGLVREAVLRWHQTPWGRALIGLLFAQGLFYGLRQLLTGALLATAEGASAPEAWASERGQMLLWGIQGVTLLLAGVLAGVGQRYGPILGAIIGVWNGALSAALNQNPGAEQLGLSVLVQPLLHAACAGLGGCIGTWVWRPLPDQGVPTALIPRRKAAPRRKLALLAGQVAWFRIMFGAALAVAGTLTARIVFEKVLSLGGGKLGTSTEFQDTIILWEIKALAMIVGGALAGATTHNGIKQGLFVGLATSFVLIGVSADGSLRWLEIAVTTLVSSMTLCVAGAWFGGQLFPPVIKPPSRTSGPGSLA